MPIKSGYLLLAGGGGVLLWSGIKGKGVSSVFRQLAGGDAPTGAANANGITGVPGLASSSGSTPGGTPATGGAASATEKAWFTALLTAIGAPATSANMASLTHWAQLEEPGWNGPDEGGTTNNPFNHGAAPGYASDGETNAGPGIPHYGSVAEGVNATASYLHMSNYTAILSALRAGVGLNTGDPAVEQELSTWSGGGYSAA
jgi:hypothetical protein